MSYDPYTRFINIRAQNAKQQTEEEAKQKLENGNVQQNKEKPIHYDHPSTMENSTATFIYIVVWAVGAIFNDRWFIWIVASIVYFTFMARHNKK